MKTMWRRLLLGANYAAFVALAGFWLYGVTLADLHGSLDVVELDRAGVFNMDKLEKFSPELASDPRGKIWEQMSLPMKQTMVWGAWTGMAICVVNIAALHIAGRQRKRKLSETMTSSDGPVRP